MKFANLKQPINHIPKELIDLLIKCRVCDYSYPPNWLEKTEEPMVPIDSVMGGHWRLSGTPVDCPNCGHRNLFDIPPKEVNSTYLFFGDEAFREFNKKLIITYSIVGINSNFISAIDDRIRDLKQEIFPNLNTKNWTLHMKDMWASDSRKKSIFKDIPYKEITIIVDKLFRLIKEMDNGFIIYNISSILSIPNGLSKKILSERKIDLYSLLILKVIDELTTGKILPKFTFDSDKLIKSETAIHEWASRSFLGTQHSLLYAYLSGSLKIEEPKFVKPGTSPGLEIADFISYVIARYCFRRAINSPIDLDPSRIGKMYYLGFERGSDFVYEYTDSYPWELFFGRK